MATDAAQAHTDAPHGTDMWAHALTPIAYYAVDAGAGAHLLGQLPQRDHALVRVRSPWQANLLLVVGPVTPRLAPAVQTVVGGLPAQARIALIAPDAAPSDAAAPYETLLPGARWVTARDAAAVVAAIRAPGSWPQVGEPSGVMEPAPTIALPPATALEMATELEVLSLGPLQPFTAGPLRLWLVCDGEQIQKCEPEAGFAARDIARHMRRATWRAAAELATTLDPLAPMAGRLAYVRAVEQLQGRDVAAMVERLRRAALALERAQNALWWAVNFFQLVALPPRAQRTGALAAALDHVVQQLWAAAPVWELAPGMAQPLRHDAAVPRARTRLRWIGRQLERLSLSVAFDHLLALRTRGVGYLAPAQLLAADVTGPVLFASEHGSGDVAGRLAAHLALARTDVNYAARTLDELGAHAVAQAPAAARQLGAPARDDWTVLATGEALGVADGPRGRIAVRLRASGGTGPAEVSWERPSAKLLACVPELLAGQQLADAAVLVASLALAMAEADG